jgi:hypothetical protein
MSQTNRLIARIIKTMCPRDLELDLQKAQFVTWDHLFYNTWDHLKVVRSTE